MSNEFRLIHAGEAKNATILASMHRLRHQVFFNELKWTTGLQIVGDKEYDEYDRLGAAYIVRLNDRGEVDATCRLLPTSQPYMIADHYPQFIESMPIPHNNKVWEISRFCASQEARKETRGKITGQLIAAAIEFGLANNVQNYVALATDFIVPIVRNRAGWDPKPLGKLGKTPDDHSYAVIYTVSFQMLETIRKKNDINTFLLFDIRLRERPYRGVRRGKHVKPYVHRATTKVQTTQPSSADGGDNRIP